MIITFDIQTFLLIYMTIFFMLILYNISCILQRKISSKVVNKDKKILLDYMEKTRDNKDVSDSEINYLIRKLSKVNYLLAFYQIYEDNKEEVWFKKCLNKRLIVFTTLAQKYINKSTSKQSFYSYVLSQLPFEFDNKDFITTFLLHNIISSSISLRENSFLAICNCCDEDIVINAIKLLNRNNINHSYELISDDMYSASLDNKVIASSLIEIYEQLSENYRLATIKFISKTRLNYKDYFYNLLMNGTETKKVNLALIEYFRNHKDDKVIKILLNTLNITDKNNWEYAAISASVLSSYNKPRVIKALKEAITSRNWYVRNNAASSLIKLLPDDSELDEILNGNDKYAREILQYKLTRKGMKKNA